jgi:GTP-binding protein
MTFAVNDSPLCGEHGKFLTTTMIRERLSKETETNVAVTLNVTPEGAMEVSGRGELQLGVLLESMRREGFELSVSPPKVVYKTDPETRALLEPIEEVIVDVDTEFAGVVIEKLSQRKAEMSEMLEYGAKSRIFFEMPTRGLLGYMGEFKNDTHGTGVLNHLFLRYDAYKGKLDRSRKGAMISSAAGQTTAHALEGLEPRGVLFVGPGTKVYPGMIIGEHNRDHDLEVNPVKAKQLTNFRTTLKEDAVRLTPPKNMTLEEIIAYCQGIFHLMSTSNI